MLKKAIRVVWGIRDCSSRKEKKRIYTRNTVKERGRLVVESIYRGRTNDELKITSNFFLLARLRSMGTWTNNTEKIYKYL